MNWCSTRNQALRYNAARDDAVLRGISHIASTSSPRNSRSSVAKTPRMCSPVSPDASTHSSPRGPRPGHGPPASRSRWRSKEAPRRRTRPHPGRSHQGPRSPTSCATPAITVSRGSPGTPLSGRGRPARAGLALRAFHEGGQVNIEIADDGAGVDPQRIRAKVVERGDSVCRTGGAPQPIATRSIWSSCRASLRLRRSRKSRAAASGMDVVRTHIEGIGGTPSTCRAARGGAPRC